MSSTLHLATGERWFGVPDWITSMRALGRHVVASTVIATARVTTGLHARWVGCAPLPEQRIYFGNHVSHGDFVLIWSALPPLLRANARPVAGADYWNSGRLRRFLAQEVFDSVLIERGATSVKHDLLKPIKQALSQGSSLIVFPEGTRNTTDHSLLEFKSGIFYLATAYPAVALVPVWIENVGRVMPKGEVLPVPLLCSVTFGAPMRILSAESKGAFLERARNALLALAPDHGAKP